MSIYYHIPVVEKCLKISLAYGHFNVIGFWKDTGVWTASITENTRNETEAKRFKQNSKQRWSRSTCAYPCSNKRTGITGPQESSRCRKGCVSQSKYWDCHDFLWCYVLWCGICLCCYSECISTPGKLKNLPDHGGNQTHDIWFASLMQGWKKYRTTGPLVPEKF